jgi:hypothetical protein
VNPDVFRHESLDDFDEALVNVTLKIDHQEVRTRLHDDPEVGLYWMGFSEVVAEGAIKDYATGHVDYQGAVNAVHRCVLACGPFETGPVSYVIQLANLTKPRTLNRRRPRFPPWVICVAVTIYRLLKEENPDQPSAPDEYTEWTSPILKATVDWLVTLGVCDDTNPILQHTVYRWYRAEENKPPQKKMRRRKIRKTSGWDRVFVGQERYQVMLQDRKP